MGLINTLGKKWRPIVMVMMVIVIIALYAMLARSYTDLNLLQTQNLELARDNALQKQVILDQSFNYNRFNEIAGATRDGSARVDFRNETTVVQYREILKYEKICNLSVPADIADGLYDYTNRLRARTMYADPENAHAASHSPATTRQLTYCQAVLWINPLLSALEKANQQLAAIALLEKERK